MKRAKRYGMVLTALLWTAALTGCGLSSLDKTNLFEENISEEDNSGENNSGNNIFGGNDSEENSSEGEDSGNLPSNSKKDSEIMTEFTFDDIEGYWYGVSDKGTVYTMQIYQGAGASSEISGTLFFGILGDEIARFNDGIHISPVYETSPSGVVRTGEDGNPVTKTDADGNIMKYFKATHLERYDSNSSRTLFIEGNPYTDGSLHVTASIVEQGSQVPTEDTIVFTHNFSLPALEVNREEGTLSGVWHTSLKETEDSEALLMAYPNGTFYMREVSGEGSLISGDYQMDGDTVTLTAKMMDGNPYKGADSVVFTTFQTDNSFEVNGIVMLPVTGKHNGSWICDSAEEIGDSEAAFYLELDENGGFTTRIMENGEVTQEAIGLCLYRSDTEADLLVCVIDGRADFSVAGLFIIWSDGAVTLTPDPEDTTLHFRKN